LSIGVSHQDKKVVVKGTVKKKAAELNDRTLIAMESLMIDSECLVAVEGGPPSALCEDKNERSCVRPEAEDESKDGFPLPHRRVMCPISPPSSTR
jgi:hypothetical protein